MNRRDALLGVRMRQIWPATVFCGATIAPYTRNKTGYPHGRPVFGCWVVCSTGMVRLLHDQFNCWTLGAASCRPYNPQNFFGHV